MSAGSLPEQRSLRIVFVVPRFHTNLYFATRALIEAGHIVHLICRDRAEAEDHSRVSPHYLSATASFGEIWALLRRLDPDLLVIRDVPGLTRKFLVAGMAQRRRLYAYDQHPVSRHRSLRKFISDMLRGRPLRRITPIPGLQQPTQPARLSHYLPFPVAQAGGQNETSAGDGKQIRILCVGKLAQPRKNHQLLLQALAELPAEFAWRLTLAGATETSVSGGSDRYLDALRRQASDGPLADKLTILENVPFQDMAELYATHDICVLPSVDEPLGTSPLEAMAYGCVPVISDGCGSAGYIPSEEYGFVVRGCDVESLRLALEKLLASPARLGAMSAKVRELAATEFSEATFVRRVEVLAARR